MKIHFIKIKVILIYSQNNYPLICINLNERYVLVIDAATQCALATSQLVACAKVVAPSLQSPACRQQLETAAREVMQAVQSVIQVCMIIFYLLNKFIYLIYLRSQVCNEATQQQSKLNDLNEAASEVSKTLSSLLNHIKNSKNYIYIINAINRALIKKNIFSK